jgi:hypothetical protein
MQKKSSTSARTKRPARASNTNHTPSDKEIAARAYEIFLSRGATHGHALDDWLQAERELVETRKEIAFAHSA